MLFVSRTHGGDCGQCGQAVGSVASCWDSSVLWAPGTSSQLLAGSDYIQLCRLPLCSLRDRQSGLLGNMLQRWGEQRLSLLSQRRNCGPRSLLAVSWAALEDGWCSKVKLFLSLFRFLWERHLFQFPFAPLRCWNISGVLLGFHKGVLIHEWSLNWCFWGRACGLEPLILPFCSVFFSIITWLYPEWCWFFIHSRHDFH